MTKAEVRPYHGSPAIFINDRPYPPMMATVNTRKDGKPTIDRAYFKRLGESGIKIFFLICDTKWLVEDAFDLCYREMKEVLSVVPDAYFMLRIGLHPPLSWLEAHPEETVTFSDGGHQPFFLRTESYKATLPGMYSLCSSVWRQDAGKALIETCEWVESTEFADRVIGYFLAAGNTSEWYYDGSAMSHSGGYPDFSEGFRRNFEEYLRQTYSNDVTALRKAWHDDTATFEHPRIPAPEERDYFGHVDELIRFPKNRQPQDPVDEPPCNGTHVGIFTDLDHSKNMYDYMRAWHTGSAKSVIYFADLIKRHNPALLTGAFYGSCGCVDYIWGGTSAATVPVLRSGVVDFLAAPGVYQNRQPGGYAGQREAIDSFRLHNCMFIVEEDTRTHAENGYFGDLYEVFTKEDTLNIMKRDFGRDLCEDVSAWWFDQHPGGGRYRYEEIYELIARQQRLAAEAYEQDRAKHADVAFIYDDESINAVSAATNFQAVEFMRDYELAKIGTGVDWYMHDDMADPAMPEHKLYVFCNVYVLTEPERRAIREKLKKDGATALWLYAPGAIDPQQAPHMDVAYMKDLTGFDLIRKDLVVSSKFRITPEAHPLTAGMDPGEIYGFNYRYLQNNINNSVVSNTQLLYPAFVCEDRDATVLGRFLQEPWPALAVKEYDGFTSVFCGTRTLRCDALRSIARAAGAHIYCDSDDVIYAGGKYITIHAAHSGTKTLHFKANCTPVEVYEETAYGENVTEITFSMLKGQTKTFRM